MPQSVQTELSDLLLDVGESWVCGPTGAGLYGIDGFLLEKPFHLLVLRGRNIQRVGAVIHTTTRLDLIDRAVVDGFPVTSATRTLIDLASTTPPAALATAIAAALRDGLTSESFLHKRLAVLRGSGRAGTRRLLAVLDGEDIAARRPSWLERHFLELIVCNHLPKPDTEVVLTRARDKLVRVDCRFPGTNVVVELLGYRWHRTREQLVRDAERLNQLQLAGYLVLQFTYEQVVNEADAVIELVRRVLGR